MIEEPRTSSEVIWEGIVGDPLRGGYAQLVGLSHNSGVGLMWIAPKDYEIEQIAALSQEQAIALRDWLNAQYPHSNPPSTWTRYALPKAQAQQLIQALKAQDMTQEAIIQDLWGATKGGSTKYKEALAEFQSLTDSL